MTINKTYSAAVKAPYTANEHLSADIFQAGVNAGLPTFEFDEKTTSFFEFWPVWLIYFPVALYWLVLSLRYRSFGLPMVVNPRIPLGGMVGESKSAILNDAGPTLKAHILPYITFNAQPTKAAEQARELVSEAQARGLVMPMVVKPDLGCRGSGVQLVHSVDQLTVYLNKSKDGQVYLLQQLAPFGAEAGVFYVRKPGEARGRIVSFTLKYRPTVRGDGFSSLRQLIEQHPRARKMARVHLASNRVLLDTVPIKGEEVALAFAGSHCRGSIFRNGAAYISTEMELVFDALLKELPGFHYGRLDVKFRDIHSFSTGKYFHIIEINGASSEQTHIWDSRTRFVDAMATLFGQYKLLFEMGSGMRSLGYAVPSVVTLIRVWLRELQR
ncbi:D-alanine--D-alanine ligase [Teredinibacter franksiae]|uniref:D-alanine--D-alanine ligase n=1 Tax=Teredinibacter franksiae TaxID=2761453 RepID=UPI001FE9616D|nr:D-alanine--D-alanine ligase [Teredinibacter franksiae]